MRSTAMAYRTGLCKMEIPAKVKLCAEEWTTENGLLTAAIELKRTAIIDEYKTDINKMFSNTFDSNNNNKNNKLI